MRDYTTSANLACIHKKQSILGCITIPCVYTFVTSKYFVANFKLVSYANHLVTSLESAAFAKEKTKIHVEYIGSEANSTQPSRSIGLRASEANLR